MKISPYIAIPLLLTACPIFVPMDESTDDGADDATSTGDGDGDGDGDGSTTTGDGDGDSGDGDGDGEGDGDACLEPTFGADSNNMRWVTFDTWPAWAQFAEPVDLQDGIDSGTLVLVDMGLDAECYEIEGFAMPTCVFEVECVKLIGYPLGDAEILPDGCAPVGGAWDSAGFVGVLGSGCWGAIGDFAVRLRDEAPVCEGPAGSVGCACELGICLDGLTCKSDFCSP
jgi:hypothetical protein